MKRPKKLSASFVKTVNRPGRYGDGRGGFGLSLLVKPTTTGRLSKTWSQRLRIHGSSVNVGLGGLSGRDIGGGSRSGAGEPPDGCPGAGSPLWRCSDVRRGRGRR